LTCKPSLAGKGRTQMNDIDLLCINSIRTLSMDATQKARSGHPGTPMGLAPVAYTLWRDYIRYDPKAPLWPNRDRFVLSPGHASMLLYSILHLVGVQAADADGRALERAAVSLHDLQSFRQLDSLTPGHPEYGHTTGVEATTGPLGQGIAMSVGLAIAEKWMGAHFNRPGHTVIDYNIYALCSDGEMMEGVSGEAASLAAHLRLDNLCWIYDSNHVTLDGPSSASFSEDVGTRFVGYGWNVMRVEDGNDLEEVKAALDGFLAERERPTLVIVETHIGFGSPNKQDSNAAHGEPLGEEEARLTKKAYGWPEEAQFLVPAGVYENFEERVGRRGSALRAQWQAAFKAFELSFPELEAELRSMLASKTPEAALRAIPSFPADSKGIASRDSSGRVENAVAQHFPWLLGGSADLDTSTRTRQTFAGSSAFTATDRHGRNLHFGVREHAMGAIANGLALSGIRPYASTFLVFSDYMRPAIRMAALMKLPTIFIFTHDSFSVGEDGPTHQPVEQIASLRAVPGLITIRPCDANEVGEAWRVILPLEREPVALILSRQPLPTLDRVALAPASGLARGAYVLTQSGTDEELQVILIATGSEVSLAVAAFDVLRREGVSTRVVSMPSWELFERQEHAYRNSVLPPRLSARVAIEQGVAMGWDRYVGHSGVVMGMGRFGASAPMKDLAIRFGFTVERVVEAARLQMAEAAA
jgi:transketolase